MWVGSVTQRWVCLLREVVQEEVVPPGLPQHTVRNLPPFTNVSLLLLLSNPEGRRESAELLLLTDQDGRRRPRPPLPPPPPHPPTKLHLLPTVPGAVPVESVLGSSYEQQISLSWREPLHTYGRIRTYEVRPTGGTTHTR